MSDLPPSAPSAPGNPPVPPPPDAPAVPAKRPGLLRPSALILILLLLIAAAAVVPFVVDPWVRGQIATQLAARNLRLGPDTELTIALLDGKVAASKLSLIEDHAGTSREIFAADELVADVAVWDSLSAGDLVIDLLSAQNARGDLERRGDGSVPVITPPEEPGKPIDWSKVDWYGYGKRIVEWLKERREAEERRQEEEAKKPPEERERRPPPTPGPSTRHPEGRRYHPTPRPGERGPRVLIRKLDIVGGRIGMPDDTPFEVESFAVRGSDVTGIQLPEETMALTIHLATRGAGEIDLEVKRAPGEDGTLTLVAQALPLAVLADPKIGGGDLAKYDPKGIGRITLDTRWQGWALGGTLTGVLREFDFSAPAGASREVEQAAQLIKQHKGKELTWPMQLGGTLYAPRITDTGAKAVGKAIAAGALDAGKQEAIERLQGDKKVQQATEGVKEKTGIDLNKLPGLGR